MQDIAVGVAKLKEQMSNPMFLASKEKTHTHTDSGPEKEVV